MAQDITVCASSQEIQHTTLDKKTVAVNSERFFDSSEAFYIPQRQPARVNPFKLIFNLLLAFGLVAAVITGYVIGLAIFDLGFTSIGMYGVVVISVYIFQVFSAVWNRYDVNRITKELMKKTSDVQTTGDCEKGEQCSTKNTALNPGAEISIAAVGYREDDQAWRQCISKLQKQTLKPKCILGVVDGDEAEDLIMAEAFVDEYRFCNAPHIRLPVLLSTLHFDTYQANIPADNRSRVHKVWHWLTGRHRPGHTQALAIARQTIINQVLEWDEKWNISGLRAVVFSQPHGHKRTALFTAFAMNMYAIRTRDAIFTTDSDTILEENALDEMMALMQSSDKIGGISAAVKIWNCKDNLLTRLCSTRYWFAFNIERACQSTWGCVSCLSGPIALYRACDLDTILGPWNLQMFGGKHTTFGDDRHLTNQILSQGLKTRYTHRTWCDSESPVTFVRWITQQTRWTKSFFREVFWFPKSFAYHHPWMLLEMSIHTLYPFFLLATIFHLLFSPGTGSKFRPLVWLVTIFGLAFVKSLVALFIEFDLWLLLFAFYGFIHFFGLLPTKLWALVTLKSTGWGTGARSATERRKGQSFLQRSFLIGHLVVWFACVFAGISYFAFKMLKDQPMMFLICVAGLLITVYLYWDSNGMATAREKAFGWMKRRKPTFATTQAPPVAESALPVQPTPAMKAPFDKEASVNVETKHISPSPTPSIERASIVVQIPPKTVQLQ